MKWTIEYLPEVVDDVKKLDGSAKRQVVKAIEKVQSNPLPISEGGYGKPLGHKGDWNLTGLFKIKLKKLGIRVLYQLIRDNDIMTVVIIGARSDDQVYKDACERLKKYNII